MSLVLLAKSLRQGEVLLPRLRRFLGEEDRKYHNGFLKRKEIVIEDARMTIETFQQRLKDYQQPDPVGEYFHPSALGACLRDLWYHAKKAPKDKGKEAVDLLHEHLIFETGTYIGVVIQNLCERAGFLQQREVPIVSKRFRIRGHADGLLYIDGRDYVLEIKTINSRGFTKLGKPQKSHVKQAHGYMKVLGQQWAIILYIEKDRHALKEFVVPFNQKFYEEEVAGRIDQHFKNLKSNLPPDREGENPNLFPCRYCCHKRVCFGASEGRQFLKELRARPAQKTKTN